MTQKSKSRNASCVPFRGRGPRSGEGVDGGKNDYDILILCLIALKGKRLTTFCASLRSGGRRLAVRTAMEHPIGALPRTPFPASRDFPSRGNEKIGGTGYCVTYDTDSQSRNVLASPLGEEGHEVAKGCTRVRMIMILDVDVTAERRHYNTHRPLKGKRLTTFCASLALLQNVFAVHRRAPPQPFEPSEPYEPSEPSRPQGVSLV